MSGIEVYQTTRPVREMAAGLRLRIVDPKPFQVRYTLDGWATTLRLDAQSVGYSGCFADLPTEANQSGSIIFTLYWPEEGRWLGHNVEVALKGSRARASYSLGTGLCN